MKKIFIHQNQTKKALIINQEKTILEVLRNYAYVITANCGGMGQCKKCLVEVNGSKVLACQTKIEDNMNIYLENKQDLITPENLAKNESYLVLDIGTTTLVCCLIDKETKQVLKQIARLNPQIMYGADIITRIKQVKDGHLIPMQNIIIQEINSLIKSLLENHKPQRLIIAGNTTMIHLVMGIDPSQIGKYPYQAQFLTSLSFKGDKLNLQADEVLIPPHIGAFLGSDVVLSCLAINLLEQEKPSLFVDFGTNGEMVLKVGDNIWATSTAVGPAFEGTNIEKGMAGIKGAIYSVDYDGKLNFKVIDNEALGICGSGLIDIISILIKEGLLDKSGKLINNQKSSLSKNLIKQTFYITDNVYITQKDIRQFQLAKSAILTGIEILLKKASLKKTELKNVYISGGFGSHINIKSAITCGLIPKTFFKKTTIINNACILGGILLALDSSLLAKGNLLAKKTVVVDLNKEKKFNNYFIRNLTFNNAEEKLQ